MDDDGKRAMVLAAAEEGEDRKVRLSCAKALALCAEHGIAVQELGRICDRAGIKISACQLGCFK